MDQGRIRTFVYYEWLLGNDTGTAVANICRACKEDAVSQRTGKRWFNRFESGDTSLEDREHHALLLAKGMLYFELLPQGRTVTASIYTDQLEKLAAAIREKRPRRASVHLHNNARPHVAKETQQKFATLGWETVGSFPMTDAQASTGNPTNELSTSVGEKKLLIQKHVAFLKRHLAVFPEAYNSLDTNRVTLLFFAISALDVLGKLDETLSQEGRDRYIAWIYKLQLTTALYCEPQKRDFGVASFGERGFGGLLLDPQRHNEADVVFVPQFNLESFWRRKIAPFPIGAARRLVEPRVTKLRFRRTPGAYAYRTPDSVLHARNLLVAKICKDQEDDGVVRLWTVNERSNCRLLEEFEVPLDKDGDPIVDGCLAWRFGKRDGKKLNEEAVELRLAVGLADENPIWIRCLHSLNLLVDRNKKAEKVFQNCVQAFDENRAISGEISIIDVHGDFWTGHAEKGLMRLKELKFQEKINAICYSNHPRTLYVGSGTSVKSYDVRGGSANTLLFESLIFESKRDDDNMKISAIAKPTSEIRHLCASEDHPNNLFAVSEHMIHLLDERFPGRPLLSMAHSIPRGGHYALVSRAVRDPLDDGEIVSCYHLDQFLTGICATRFYYHSSSMWSAVCPVRALDKPGGIATLSSDEWKRASQTYDRSVAVVQGVRSGHSDADIVFRQVDDGGIWFQRFNYIQPDCLERPTAGRDYPTTPVYVAQLPDGLRASDRDATQLVAIDGPLERKLMKKLQAKAALEYRSCASGLAFEDGASPEPLLELPFVEEARLTKVIRDMWITNTNPPSVTPNVPD